MSNRIKLRVSLNKHFVAMYGFELATNTNGVIAMSGLDVSSKVVVRWSETGPQTGVWTLYVWSQARPVCLLCAPICPLVGHKHDGEEVCQCLLY